MVELESMELQLKLALDRLEMRQAEWEETHLATIRVSESGRSIDEYLDMLMDGFNTLQNKAVKQNKVKWFDKLLFIGIIINIILMVLKMFKVY